MAPSRKCDVDNPLDLPPLNIPRLLRQNGLHPDKSLGQTFLVDPVALKGVIEAAELSQEISVLEVGSGLGSLTRYLGTYSAKVVSVELDSRLIPVLENVVASFSNVSVVQGDILKLDIAKLMGSPGYFVVANIPYYITSKLLRHLLETEVRPQRMVLTVQHEVASRICAKPGKMSLLALAVQVYGHPRICARIPAGSFYPVPKVDSAVIRIDLYSQSFIPFPLLETFFHFAKAGFSQKRKTLRNSLAAGLGWQPSKVEDLLRTANIEPSRRAETLNLDEWKNLVENSLLQ